MAPPPSLVSRVRNKARRVWRKLTGTGPKPKAAAAKPPAAGATAAAAPAPRHPLPPSSLRMGGAHFQDDVAFVATAARDVRRLRELAGLTSSSRLLDWGCGAGRLAVGVREVFGTAGQGWSGDYHGVDVQATLLDWAQANLAGPGFRFTWVDLANARYNPDGSPQRTLAAEPASVDVFYAYSVFSHLLADDTVGYLALLAEALAPGGRAFLTLFVEDDVPDCEENPEGYGPLEWKGPLHCVRYDRAWFEAEVARAGLAVVHHEHGRETDGQSLYVLTRTDPQDGS